MRKRIIFIIACFWIIISFLLIRATYSKYLTSFNAGTNIDISVWNIVLNDQNIIRDSDFTENLTLEFPGDDYYIEDYIVPGAVGYFDLEIDTTSVSMPFKYTVTVEPDDDNEIDDIDVIGYSLNGNNNTIIYLDETHTEISNTALATGSTSSIRVYVQWVDEGTQVLDDDDDTDLALNEAVAVVVVTVDFEQISAATSMSSNTNTNNTTNTTNTNTNTTNTIP
ncbi:MAG: hypothetical protein IKP28_05610 [Clostridia bacterium]|nr:hypothetical protein [Clostridia bacterium]